MTDGARSDHGLPHGTIAEEAAKLAEAAQQWLGERTAEGRGSWSHSGAPGGLGAVDDVWADATAPDDGPQQHDPPECRTCPICRAKRLVGGLTPEVFEHLAEAAVALSAAVKAMSKDAGPADGR